MLVLTESAVLLHHADRLCAVLPFRGQWSCKRERVPLRDKRLRDALALCQPGAPSSAPFTVAELVTLRSGDQITFLTTQGSFLAFSHALHKARARARSSRNFG